MKDDFLNWKQKISVVETITDLEFDSIFPEGIKNISPYQWTPVSVIQTISEYLKTEPVSAFLDLGSGPGKLAILLSLWHSFPIKGIEVRKNLFDFAEVIKEKLEIPNLEFFNRDFLHFDLSQFSHVYCFNPMYEQMTGKHSIDDSLPKSSILYIQNLLRLKERFKDLKLGSKIITYHGFGGKMPDNFRLIKKIELESGDVEIWEK
ncbi:methyltransferase [Leptospira sp. 96542]|nr:methyltransferase [Leptospira sp. 96542]